MSSAQEPNPDPAFTIGDRLRKARERAGMEKQELADAIEVDRKTISNYEMEKVEPRPMTLRQWALCTGVSLEWVKTGKSQGRQPESPEDGQISPKRPRPGSNRGQSA